MKIDLRSPVEDSGKTFTEVEMREVRTGDIRRIGQPVGFSVSRSDPDLVQITSDPEKVFRYVQAMSGLTPTGVDALHPADYMQLAEHVQQVFIDLQTPTE